MTVTIHLAAIPSALLKAWINKMLSRTCLSAAIFTLTTIITGCGTTPVANIEPTPVIAAKPVQQQQPLNAQDWLHKARKAWQQQQSISLRNNYLLQAAEQYKSSGNCHNSSKIARLLLPELHDYIAVTHANLLLAECAASKPNANVENIRQYLANTSDNTMFAPRIYRQQALLYRIEQRWLDAALATLKVADEQTATEIWYLLQQLSQHQLEEARLNQPQLQAWIQLALISRRYAFSPAKLRAEINTWQQRHRSHILAHNLPAELLQAMSIAPLQPQQIAVLLPLSGRLASQGQAIKNGILAAYYQQQQKASQGHGQQQPEVQFFNVALKTPAQMLEMVSGYDFVIGPLLKENLAALAQLLPDTTRLLALNRVDELQRPLAKENYYFALAPEDEASQLAAHMLRQGYRNPAIVSANSAVPKRMTDAFMQSWQQALTDQSEIIRLPTVTTFTDNKSMRNSVSELLDVAQSKQRIKQIERLVQVELYSVPRNRRDIDAIILFASPEQTELLNPIIEASMSPFSSKQVPVYASSRSYSRELGKNSLRDLRNLTFTDMPWMLPDNQWPRLSRKVDELFPGQNSGLRRLFALGYDAYKLVPDLRHLQTLPYTQHAGLSGNLSVDQSGTVRRQLPFGKITNDQVILLALD